jgi:hypothetical protein
MFFIPGLRAKLTSSAIAPLAVPFLSLFSATLTWANGSCSGGYGNESARLKPVADSADFDLILGKANPERIARAGSVGTGLNGSVYVGRSGEAEVMYFTELWPDAHVELEVKVELILFRDRVFSPCQE